VLGCSTSTGLSIDKRGTAQEIDFVIAPLYCILCIHIATLQPGTAACSMLLSAAVAEVLLALWSSISFCSPQLQPGQRGPAAQYVAGTAPSAGSWSRPSRPGFGQSECVR